MSRIRDHIALLIEVTSVGWLFLFAGCGAGSVDYSKNLGNGYIYHSNSSLDRFIAPETWNDDTPMIPSKVVRYKNNGKYITAKREIIQKGRSGSRITSGIFDYWIRGIGVTSHEARNNLRQGRIYE